MNTSSSDVILLHICIVNAHYVNGFVLMLIDRSCLRNPLIFVDLVIKSVAFYAK
jgi:hypothetical protein